MNKGSKKKNVPMRVHIYQLIRKRILQGTYAPGIHLTEEQLALEFGTSRTPVREALRRLEAEKMVRYLPYRGVVIADLPQDELEDLYEIRAFLEGIIAKRAAERATVEDTAELYYLLKKDEEMESAEDLGEISEYLTAYNLAIAKLANCPEIATLAKRVRETLGRAIVSTFTHPDRNLAARKEHHAIVAAIEQNDGTLAKTLTIEHVRNAGLIVGLKK